MSNPGPGAPAPRLASITFARPVPGGGPLADLLATGDECAWIRFGDGLVGLGTAARFTTTGPDRFAAARRWWKAATAAEAADTPRSSVPDDGPPRRSPLAFAAFAFADDSPVDSVLVVPEVVVGSSRGRSWLSWQVDLDAPAYAARAAAGWRPTVAEAEDRLSTLLAAARRRRAAAGPGAPGTPVLADGAITPEGYREAVVRGVGHIEAGTLSKLVLARDAVVRTPGPLDVPGVLRTLSRRYRDCWTYAVGGLVGSTPEMLVKVDGDTARARVLAGTLDRDGAPAGADGADHARRHLSEDPKQRLEHRLAVESLTERLQPFTTALEAPDEPFVLELPNVWHLATDVTARLVGADGARRTGPGALALTEVLHPTAAVCGTPRETAAALIHRLEAEDHGMDRGLFAGPVGWLDGNGNGEFGIALRGAVVEDAHTARLYAGCGIVAASDPAAELAETTAKMRPMLQALGLCD
ncbi:isochorismate synthase [Citricoccus sp. SGAir0253]|uniref:isochorismate synthase n=1 Tax=Citricoccus sp. SGAir0253 TaxID=2567881 RepID=UPI0010CD2854|nr:isochorismate synthase [Citricoccus sp. SGAir0253]QCU77398.1 isochorismate synthase [Citricoccus sp. SGAir0253]